MFSTAIYLWCQNAALCGNGLLKGFISYQAKKILKMSSAICFNFDQSKILSSGNELMTNL